MNVLRRKGKGWGGGGEIGNKGSRIERDHESEIETDELGGIVLTE